MKLTLITDPQSVADDMYNLVATECEFFVDTNSENFFVYYNGSSYKLFYLSCIDAVKTFFTGLYFNKHNATISRKNVNTAYESICAVASDSLTMAPVFSRLGYTNTNGKMNIYYDLVNSSGELVEISAGHTAISKKSNLPDVYFSVHNTMCEQVSPVESDCDIMVFIDEFFNVDKMHKLLLAVFICIAFIPNISYPILIIEGEKGSGKTTANKRLMQIINPVSKEVFVIPTRKDDLITTLSNNHFSAFDNVGRLSDEFSNVFCQASTGGTLNKRKLYTDNTEISLNIKRLVTLNGIDLEINKSDLLDRAILLKLNRIDESKRCPDEVIEEKFKKALPKLLGCIFNILSKALTIYPSVKLDNHPRMADFATYGYAIAEAIGVGNGNEFIRDYYANIGMVANTTVESDLLLSSLKEFAEENEFWKGTMTELLTILHKYARKIYLGQSLPSSFPKTANSLSRNLNRHKHELTNMGVDIDIGRDTYRYIEVRKIHENIVDIDDCDEKEKLA